MIAGVRLKICGLTSLVDAEAADGIGADYLGFIFYAKSPRAISLETFRAMAPRLPDRKKVAVLVEPSREDLTRFVAGGFDYFQTHFRHDLPVAQVAEWSQIVGAERLWLVPKLPAPADVADEWLPLAQHFLIDTFHAEKFGGTGMTGDWAKFRRHQEQHPTKRWMLSGGLSPANIGEAVAQSGARFVDVNSGVESAPGVKDHAKLTALAAAMRGGS